jgi:hypothetical protein
MGASIRFYREQREGPLGQAPLFETDGEHYVDLGTWLTSDVQNYAPACLELLGWVEDVRAGRATQHEWEGNSYHATILPEGVIASDLYSDARTTYTLDEAHDVMLRYWRFLLSVGKDREGSIATWELENHRTHPCRDHL